MSQPVKRKKKFSYVSSVLSISMVLLMLGLFGFLIIAGKHMETYLKENMIINVFLTNDASPDQVENIRKNIESQPFLKSLTFISKDQAATEFGNELGQDFVGFLGFNPLMGSFQVKLKENYTQEEQLKQIESSLNKIQGVAEVNYHRNAYDKAQQNLKDVGFVFIALAFIFSLIAIVLIHNTVKLNLYAQRFIIKSMQLVGATHWFILKPFILQSVQNGVLGWLLATIMLISLNQTLPIWIPDWDLFNHTDWLISMYGILLVVGLLISIGSGFFSTRKYLFMRLEDLY